DCPRRRDRRVVSAARRCAGAGPVCAEPDRVAARRGRADGAVRLALRPRGGAAVGAGRRVPAPDRGHGPESPGGRRDPGHLRRPVLVWPNLGRGTGQGRSARPVHPKRTHGALPRTRRNLDLSRPRLPLLLHPGAVGAGSPGAAGPQGAARLRPPLPGFGPGDRRRESGVRATLGGPLRDAARRRNAGPRPDPGRDRLPQRDDRRPRPAQVRRIPDLPPGQRGRRPPDGDHPYPARRRVDPDRAAAYPALRRLRLGAADPGSHAADPRPRRRKALQAPRRQRDGGVPGQWIHSRSVDELPGPARLESGRRDRNLLQGRFAGEIHPRPGQPVPGDVRPCQAALVQPALHQPCPLGRRSGAAAGPVPGRRRFGPFRDRPQPPRLPALARRVGLAQGPPGNPGRCPGPDGISPPGRVGSLRRRASGAKKGRSAGDAGGAGRRPGSPRGCGRDRRGGDRGTAARPGRNAGNEGRTVVYADPGRHHRADPVAGSVRDPARGGTGSRPRPPRRRDRPPAPPRRRVALRRL
ncbi:MAG: Glutamyl-tRNA synthetase @ Glutamyl-tRNA(Gln) synthetase, partial [uncultured Thermomicrobiales bacterium]